MSWVGAAAALLTGIALLGILAPFLRHSHVQLQKLAAAREDERLRVLRALRDLERDQARGAIDEADYQRLRQRNEVDAVALLRGAAEKNDATGELAAALRGSRRAPGPRARHGRDRGSRPRRAALLVAGLIAGAAVATTVPLLAAAVSQRPPGGLITGAQPSASPAAALGGTAASLEQRTRDHPDDLEAHLDLAQTYLEAGQPRAASQQYVEVLKRDPNNPEATTRLALLVYEAGDPDDALRGAEKVLATRPDYPEALFLKGVILLNALNRPRDAIPPLQRYLQVAPSGGYRADAQQLLTEAQAQGG
jgi:tetratricopeptide (TPR) repeat protein